MVIPALTLDFMREEDIPSAASLSRLCFSIPWSEDGYRLELRKPGSACFVARAGTELAGFLCASSVLDEAELCLIAVSPELRRSGIAAALLTRLLDWCGEHQIAVLHLEVRASNSAAAALYERFRFRRDGLRKGYYRLPPEDAVLYSLTM